jgi:hypothetical protein
MILVEMEHGEMSWENPLMTKVRRKISIYSSTSTPTQSNPRKAECTLQMPPLFLFLMPPPSSSSYSRLYYLLLGSPSSYGYTRLSPGILFTTNPTTSNWPLEDDLHYKHHSIHHPPLYLCRCRDLLLHIYRVVAHNCGEIYLSTVHFIDEMIVSHLDLFNYRNTMWHHSLER